MRISDGINDMSHLSIIYPWWCPMALMIFWEYMSMFINGVYSIGWMASNKSHTICNIACISEFQVPGHVQESFHSIIVIKPSNRCHHKRSNTLNRSIVGDNPMPAIYTPNHNIMLNPHIFITPDHMCAPPQMQPTCPETDKASPPVNKPMPRRSYRCCICANTRTLIITQSIRSHKPVHLL